MNINVTLTANPTSARLVKRNVSTRQNDGTKSGEM
jgi:hypothetical protein